MISNEARRKVKSRSGGRCEAILVVTDRRGSTSRRRCGSDASEIHHRLTKGRGGGGLDRVGEIYHLIHLCHECHAATQGAVEDYWGGMLLEGYVTWDRLHDRPVYVGPDPWLKALYAEEMDA